MASPLPDIYESYPAIAPEVYKGKLTGQVALITGCSAGIGRAIAKAFAAAGASVAAVARRADSLQTLVDEITAAGGHAIPLAADVSARGAATDLVARTTAALGGIDILINNAGITRIGPVEGEDAELDAWWRVYEVNVRAPVALIRAALPGMRARGRPATVMSTSSNVATLAYPVMTAYASSKAAISKFHELLALELVGTNIRTFAVHPGMVRSELGVADGAFNASQMEHPLVQKFLESVRGGGHRTQAPECCADLMVALAANPATAALSGHHLNASQELPPVLAEAQKDGKGRLGKERLYLVNIGTL